MGYIKLRKFHKKRKEKAKMLSAERQKQKPKKSCARLVINYRANMVLCAFLVHSPK